MNSPKLQKIFEAKTNAGVMQDKSAALVNRGASEQTYRPQAELRLNSNRAQSDNENRRDGDRTNPVNGNRHPTGNSTETLVPLTTQLRPSIKAEIQRSAKQERLSTSATAAALLERAVQGQIDMQYGAMLRPVIEDSVKKEIHACIERTTQLAMNGFLAGEQGRVLIIHVLSLLLNGGSDVLPQLVKDSQKQAWANLKYLMGQKEGEEN
jgi:hypothetical protein